MMDRIDDAIFGSKERESRIWFIEKTLREINKKKRLLLHSKLVIEICNKYGVSEEKASEYIRVAKSRIPKWMDEDWDLPTIREDKEEANGN